MTQRDLTTERKSAPAAALLEHVADSIVLVQEDGIVSYANAAARAWFESAADSRALASGESYPERMSERLADKVAADASDKGQDTGLASSEIGEALRSIGEALRSIWNAERVSFQMDCKVASAEGSSWQRISISACQIDERPGAIVVQHDITDLYKRAQELAEEVARMTLFAALTSDALALIEKGVIIDCNDTLCRLIGYSREEIIGQQVVNLVNPDDRERVREHVSKNLDASYEHRMLRKDGTMFEVAIAGRKVPYQNRTIRATSIRDLTMLKDAERALGRAQEEKLHAQATLLAELSTPLIPINDRLLVMPLIGSIDSQRAQQVLEALLSGIEQRRARIVIIDITGVRLVDSHVASTLVKAAQATRLLGAQVVLTGIRADVAQTLVRLGVDLNALTTKATLQSGIAYAIEHTT